VRPVHAGQLGEDVQGRSLEDSRMQVLHDGARVLRL